MHRLVTGLLLTVTFAFTYSGAAGQELVTVQPRPIDDVLLNPGMGFESFNRAADEPIDGAGWYPPSTIAYYRWYWSWLEPQEGAYDFPRADAAFAAAKRNGQRFAFRLMAADDTKDQGLPDWLIAKGIAGTRLENGMFVPDFNDPTFLAYAEKLIAAFGRRYDGHPNLDHVDIGVAGLWGEWHVHGGGVSDIRTTTAWRLVDAHLAAFPNTQLVMLINSIPGLQRAKGHSVGPAKPGVGWRADCLGDIPTATSTWTHHVDMYPLHRSQAGLQESWKTAPVLFETCWDVQTWVDRDYDIPSILNFALDYHASVINAKSAGIPPELKPQFEAFMKKLGYRLVLTEFSHPPALQSGQPFTVRGRWQNAGVAPPYRPYRLAYRLRSKSGQTVWSAVSDAKVGAWLPGARLVGEQFVLPAGVPAGDYHLDVAILDPSRDVPVIQLGIAGRLNDGWYSISIVPVRSNT